MLEISKLLGRLDENFHYPNNYCVEQINKTV